MDAFRILFQVLVVSMFFQGFSLGGSFEKVFQVTVQSFEREYKAKSFLKCERRPESENAIRTSFTGKRDEPGTRFRYTTRWTSSNHTQTMEFTLRPALFPEYILTMEDGKLVVKHSSSVNPVANNHQFEKNQVTLNYRSVEHNMYKADSYNIIRTRSSPPAVLRSSKSGKVTFGSWKTWKDPQTWFKIQSI